MGLMARLGGRSNRKTAIELFDGKLPIDVKPAFVELGVGSDFHNAIPQAGKFVQFKSYTEDSTGVLEISDTGVTVLKDCLVVAHLNAWIANHSNRVNAQLMFGDDWQMAGDTSENYLSASFAYPAYAPVEEYTYKIKAHVQALVADNAWNFLNLRVAAYPLPGGTLAYGDFNNV